MMIDKRLIGTVRESKKYIAGNVAFQWLSLAANIVLMAAVARLLQSLYRRRQPPGPDGADCRGRRRGPLRLHCGFQPDELPFLQGGEKAPLYTTKSRLSYATMTAAATLSYMDFQTPAHALPSLWYCPAAEFRCR